MIIIVSCSASQAFAAGKKQSSDESSRVNVTCVQTALDVREATLSGLVDTFSNASKEALQKREMALKDAWTKPTKAARQTARETAHTVYRKTIQDAHTLVKTNRKNAYTVFNTAIKNCTEAAQTRK